MRDTCAARSRACHEPTHGSASRARRWLVFEQPGSWGPDALTTSGLPATVASRLQELKASLPARVLLMRRPAGARSDDGSCQLFVAHTGPTRTWLERHDLARPEALLDLDLTPLADGESTGGEPVTSPLYLVCTHGKHDACCAEYGRPVVAALATVVADRLWECSHVGGDRFAGNLVCLPDGVLYGHLDPATARLAVDAHERREVLLEHWRGRSAFPFPIQAAEALVRDALDISALDAVHPVAGGRRDGAEHTVRLRVAGRGVVEAVVRVGRRPEPSGLTCGGDAGTAPTYELVSLRDAETSA